MNSKLYFRRSASTGIAELALPVLGLSEKDGQLLQAELHSRYDRLSQLPSGSEIDLAVGGFSRRFRLTVDYEDSHATRRCPTLILEPLATFAARTSSDATSLRERLMRLRDEASEIPDAMQRGCVLLVLDEILGSLPPTRQATAAMFACGYAALRQLTTLEAADPRSGIYCLAGRWLSNVARIPPSSSDDEEVEGARRPSKLLGSALTRLWRS